jgi:hypothetical protein
MAGAPYPAPGKFSKRTDLPRTPGLGGGDKGRSDLQSGDVGRLEAAQSAVPIPKGRPVASGQALRGGGSTRLPALLSSLLDQPTARPGEPETTGLPMGPGPGPEALATYQAPDLREQVLQAVYQQFGNEQALEMMNRIRQERQMAAQPADTAALDAFAPESEPDTGAEVSGASNFLPSVPDTSEVTSEPAKSGPTPGEPAPAEQGSVEPGTEPPMDKPTQEPA